MLTPPLKQIMTHNPLLTPIHTKQFRTRQIKQPPIDVPLPSLALPIRLLQHRLQLSTPPILIHQTQPRIARLFVIGSVDSPVVRDGEMFGKVQEEVVGGHGTAGEKGVCHPSFCEMIGVMFVGKDVDEEFAGGFEEGVDFGEEYGVILHMFEP